MRGLVRRPDRAIVGLAVAAALAASVGVRARRDPTPAAGRRPAADIPRLSFEKYTLPNGLDVILSEDHRLPMVAVNLWYHVGPANEEAGRTGFAHLFEHMMFQGSKHVPPDTHFKFLEAAGASGINGTTDFDRTNYFETLPANQLELALWLESDRMGYLLDTLDEQQLANQQDVVRNERRQTVENRPYGLAEEAVTQLIFPPGHPYHADVIGSHADIQAATLDEVKRFFKQYYTPNNASLAIVGDIDTVQVRRLVERYFGTLRRGPQVPPVTAVTPPITAERRRIVTDRVELPRVYLAWITPPLFALGDAEADVAAAILGGGPSSRLYKTLVYERQIAQNVRARQSSLRLGSMFQIEVTARPGHTADEIERAVDEELATFRSAGPEPSEVERAQNTIEARIIQGLERLGGFGGVADRLNMYNQFLGTPDYLARDIARYRAVTPASIRAFAADYLKPPARAVVHAVPGEKVLGPPVPAPVPKAEKGKGAESINADEPWRARPPQAGPARPLRVGIPESARLANGLTLLLSPRPGLPVVAATLVVRTGSDANPLDKPGLASFTAAMLDQGTSMRTALQIADEVAGLGASLSVRSTMDATVVEGRSLKRTFDRTLDLMADVVRHPSFPAAEIERQRASRLAQLVQQRESASQIASRVVAAALYGARHPYGYTEIGTEAGVKRISQNDLQAFWRQHFVPNNAALIVAGDITMKELRPLVERAFGAWASGSPARGGAAAPPETTTARLVMVDKPGAPQTELRVAAIGAPRSTPDYFALRVMNTALGELFSSRINMNLREEHGYTYGASSQFAFRRLPGPFVAGAAVRADATAPALAELLKEIRGMADKPVDGDELRLAKDALVRSLPGAFETSAGAAANLSTLFVFDLGLDYFARYAARVGAVTAAEVRVAAARYLAPERLIAVAVGDRASIEPALRALTLGPVEIWSADGGGPVP